MLHLVLFRVAVADHGLLDLQGSVLGHRKACENGGADRGSARLPEGKRGLRIYVDEYFFNRDFDRPVRGDDFVQPFEQRLQAPGEIAAARFDAAAGNIPQLAFAGFDDAEAGDLQAWVDAENPQSITAVV